MDKFSHLILVFVMLVSKVTSLPNSSANSYSASVPRADGNPIADRQWVPAIDPSHMVIGIMIPLAVIIGIGIIIAKVFAEVAIPITRFLLV